MKFIIILVVVAFSTVKGIDMISSNTSNVIVNHTNTTDMVVNDATR